MSTRSTTPRRCTHWSFTATQRGTRIHYRCAQPGCRHRWRRKATSTAKAA